MTGLDRDETPMFGWVFCWEFGLKPENGKIVKIANIYGLKYTLLMGIWRI
jgi:hypothetical protein